MDTTIFDSRFGSKEIQQAASLQVEVDWTSEAFLVFHLMCDKHIESFIYNVCGIEDFLFNKQKNREVIGFLDKVVIAKNLGLHPSLASTLSEVNSIRNKYAHRLKKEEITNKIPEIRKRLEEAGKHFRIKPLDKVLLATVPFSSDENGTDDTKPTTFENSSMPFQLLILSCYLAYTLKANLQQLPLR